MAKKNRKTVRNGLLIAGSVMTLAIFGVLSMFQLNVPSLKQSSDHLDDSTNETFETQRSEQLASIVTSDESHDSDAKSDTPNVGDGGSPAILDILIDGDEYYVFDETGNDSTRQSMTATRIVMSAGELDGNVQGIKVRIRRTFDATAQAEQKLLDALKEGGLNNDQIDLRQQLVGPAGVEIRSDD